MTAVRPSSLVRLLPSLLDVIFLMPFVLVLVRLGGARFMIEGDTGWHIRAGEWMIANGQVLKQDVFSFTKTGETWYAWEWLWDVAFGAIHLAAGMPGVVFASMLVLCLTFAWLYHLTHRVSGHALVSAIVTLVAMCASTMHWWARPHIFTLLFLVIFLDVVDRHSRGETSRLWLLPLLTILWTNLHGGFFMGMVVIGAFAAHEVITGLLAGSAVERNASFSRVRPYALTIAACFAATFVNPFGYHLHGHILEYLGNTNKNYFQHVGEWQSLSFYNPMARFFEAMIFLSLPASLLHTVRRRFAYPILMMALLHLALLMGRNIPPFVVLAAPGVAWALREALELFADADVPNWLRQPLLGFQEIASEVGGMERIWRFHALSVAVVALIALAWFRPHSPKQWLYADYDHKAYPVEALEKIAPAELAGNVFTPDEWGDYLIYRKYPATKVYVDGRFDFYGEKHTAKYLDLAGAKHDWAKRIDEFKIRRILLPVESPLTSVLKESRHWQVLYDDGIAIFFGASGAQQIPATQSVAEASGARTRGPLNRASR